MKLHMRLLVLFGIFMVISHCQDEDAGSNEEAEAIEHEADEDYDHSQDAEDDDGEGGEEFEKFDPLTSEQARGLHKKIDANGNGKVSIAEASEYATKMRRAIAQLELDDVMKTHDSNKDGKLTLEEFMGEAGDVSENRQNEVQTEFNDIDHNKDGFVDATELTSLYHHHVSDEVETKLTKVAMQDKDTNKDGKISLEEFYQHLQVEGEPPVDIEEEDKAIFKQLDTDNSGTLSLTELKAWESGSYQAEEAVRKLFMHADKDHDNVITVEELDRAREDIANHEDIDAQMYLMQWVANHDDL